MALNLKNRYKLLQIYNKIEILLGHSNNMDMNDTQAVDLALTKLYQEVTQIKKQIKKTKKEVKNEK